MHVQKIGNNMYLNVEDPEDKPAFPEIPKVVDVPDAPHAGQIVRTGAGEWALIVSVTPEETLYQKIVQTSLTSAPISKFTPPEKGEKL